VECHRKAQRAFEQRQERDCVGGILYLDAFGRLTRQSISPGNRCLSGGGFLFVEKSGVDKYNAGCPELEACPRH
jgi:hypothetical protein